MGNERILLQQFFDEGGTEAKLTEEYGIQVRASAEFPQLHLYKYDQIDSDKCRAHPLVVQCRGIILDTADNYRVVCRSLDRFFNEGMSECATIDWSSACVQEKVDGSLCQVYWYAGQWRVATSGTPDAGGECNGFGFTFKELFWKTVDEVGLELPVEGVGCSFFFELGSPYNRIVVRHEKASLTLLGGRDLRTQIELSARDVASLYLPTATPVREFALSSFAEIAAALETMNPLVQEGFVTVDGHFNRQKSKAAAYVLLHRAKDGCNPRSLFEIARAGENSEVEQAFPELKEQLDVYRAKIDDWCDEVELDFHRLRDIPVQRDFAHAALTTLCSSALFAIRAGKVRTAREFLGKVSLDTAMSWLGVKTAG
jgi:hypothetical protein